MIVSLDSFNLDEDIESEGRKLVQVADQALDDHDDMVTQLSRPQPKRHTGHYATTPHLSVEKEEEAEEGQAWVTRRPARRKTTGSCGARTRTSDWEVKTGSTWSRLGLLEVQ